MSFNTFIIIIILLLFTVFIVVYFRSYQKMDDLEIEYDKVIAIDSLTHIVNDAFNVSLRRSIKDMNLDSKTYQKELTNKNELKMSLRLAPSGDKVSKAFIKKYIHDILVNEKGGKVTERNIDTIIPFNNANRLKGRDMFEILAFMWLKYDEEKGFSTNFCKYGLDAAKITPYGKEYTVTDEDIKAVYELYLEEYGNLTYRDKIDYLTQRVYEELLGLGPIDILLETDVDEIQGGTSGIPYGTYDVKTSAIEDEDDEYSDDDGYDKYSYSYEAVWIVFHGLNIHLKCTTFGTQQELVRITRNVYRYNAPYILSERDAKVVGSMKCGNRVSAMQPPFAESYAFLIRKFDSTPSINPAKLLKEEASLIAKYQKDTEEIAIEEEMVVEEFEDEYYDSDYDDDIEISYEDI